MADQIKEQRKRVPREESERVEGIRRRRGPYGPIRSTRNRTRTPRQPSEAQ